MLEIGCDLYALPNMHRPYLLDVEERLEAEGANFDDAHIVYAGGMLYGSEAQARHPDATVTVVEKEPIVAYLQAFAAHEIDQGRDRNDIMESLFLIDGERAGNQISSRQDFVTVSEQEYEAIQERHRAFID
ncbi:MAG: hypothetical protein SVU32_04615, partial [Candidatus Nanohaloarchaea archaeon]|nr:hypothetical protein [Candidatus Nanohaloarchaea archaeon]